MAGKAGRSGGARPGAGRPKGSKNGKSKSKAGSASVKRAARSAPETPVVPVKKDPLAFLEDVMNDPKEDIKVRVRAAVAAAQYRHIKKGDGGKKDEAAGKASKAAAKFATAAPPRLVSSR